MSSVSVFLCHVSVCLSVCLSHWLNNVWTELERVTGMACVSLPAVLNNLCQDYSVNAVRLICPTGFGGVVYNPRLKLWYRPRWPCMTLNNLKRRNSPYFAFFRRFWFLCWPNTSQWLNIDLYCPWILSLSSSLPLLAITNPPYSAVSLR